MHNLLFSSNYFAVLVRCAVLFLVFTVNGVTAQTLKGNLTELAGQTIVLEGYRGAKNYTIANVKANAKGVFTIPYNTTHYGVATLQTAAGNNFPVLLNGETIELKGKNLTNVKDIKVLQGKQNMLFAQYNYEQSLRDQAITGWAFLDDLYYKEAFLANNKQELSPAQQLIIKELERLRLQEQQFIKSLPKDSYLSWFLNTKKLITSVENVVKYRPQFAPNFIKIFRELNYTDQKLYNSGLFAPAISNQFWLLQKVYTTPSVANKEIKTSIDSIYAALSGNDTLINEATELMFKLFEQQGANDLSEYLALKALNDEECALSDDVTRKLERYRNMKVGAIVADITFGPQCNFPNQKEVTTLAAIESPYTLVVFAAGWCPHCINEIPKIAAAYTQLKAKGVQVVLVTLDETEEEYQRFTKGLPFISTTDLKKWDSQAVNDYYVNGTPTYYLVNKDLELVLNPRNLEQVDTWVRQHLNN
jgi:thiol-disulfide isomerase/thioredoxin